MKSNEQINYICLIFIIRPGHLFHQQKTIEYEWQRANSSIQDFQEQLSKWMIMFKSLMDKFKQLGSLQTWTENLERRMTIVAHTIQHKHDHSDIKNESC